MFRQDASQYVRYDDHVANDRISEVGVLDKAAALLDALAESGGPFALAQLASHTQIHRATAHRLLKALEIHGYARMDDAAKWSLGPRLLYLGQQAAVGLPLRKVALPALSALRDATTESVQLFVRQGEYRVCIASLESPHGLRTIVHIGASMALPLGSAGRLLSDQAAAIRVRRSPGWVQSIGEREAGVASVSAPIFDTLGTIQAAVSISGPIERLTRDPGTRYGAAVGEIARAIERSAGWQPRLT
jgi:DNA-binding IclR family transcriptional regulator